MTPSNELLFLTNEELIAEIASLVERADQESAHEQADEVMVIALLRAADGELTHTEAAELTAEYQQLNRKFA